MTITELLIRYQPHNDIATHRQVFSCPQCGERVLGPDPAEERPTWIIPLLCCARQALDEWWMDKPPRMEDSVILDRTLELRRHVVWHRRTGQRFLLWFPAPS